MDNNVAKYLLEERQRLNLTQEAASKIAGVSPLTFRRWEKGESPIPSDAIMALVKEGFDPVYIFTGYPLAKPEQVAEERAVFKMTPEERAKRALGVVVDVTHEMGLNLTSKQMQILVGYVFDHSINHSFLKEFITAAFGVTGKELPNEKE